MSELTFEQLHERMVAECERLRDAQAQQARHHRALQAKAKAHGEHDIALKLGMLAANLEQSAALAEAERRDRIASFERWQRAEKNRERARKPRPGRRTLADKIRTMFAPLKREGEAFKLVLRAWESDRIGSLRLSKLDGGRYLVTDEDGDDGDRGEYKLGTLEKLYSKAR
ncbi:hypothetical protein [Azohydromonas sediminis]|uniref:hypothetical protein n=1 Tax=Azohydromonas sediminis TaxID=2259674 RepID=UPI000E6521E8|nr:hypothetical protein [Azohydromonas sediminis]